MKKFQEVVLGGLVVLLVAGLIHWLSRPERGIPLQVDPPPTPGPITVYVIGEVYQPGVYALPLNSRTNDVVIAAGGLTENANQVAINLAEKLRDGQKVVIPAIGETIVYTDEAPLYGSALTNLETQININTASQSEFEMLPGIGQEKAARIVSYRSENGPFSSIEEIQKVPGIGMQIFKQIEPYLKAE